MTDHSLTADAETLSTHADYLRTLVDLLVEGYRPLEVGDIHRLQADQVALREIAGRVLAAEKALRDQTAAVDNLSALTEGIDRVGTAIWLDCDRDVYSLAIEEAQAALRAALAEGSGR